MREDKDCQTAHAYAHGKAESGARLTNANWTAPQKQVIVDLSSLDQPSSAHPAREKLDFDLSKETVSIMIYFGIVVKQYLVIAIADGIKDGELCAG